MKQSFKRTVIDNFNKAALAYDNHAYVQKLVAEQLLSKIKNLNPKSILEIGCGTGLLTELVSAKFLDANYFISDIANEMVYKCKNKHQDMSFFVCDGEHLPINNQMDLIISNCSFQWFENLGPSLRDISKYGKVVAFSTFISGTFGEWVEAHNMIGVENNLSIYHSLEYIEKICSQIDHTVVEISTQNIEIRFTNAIEFLHSLKHIGASASYGKYDPIILKKLLKIFQDGINVNYNIAYCILKT